jgi:hypothetical protein
VTRAVLHAGANRVACPDCNAPIGTPCHNLATKQPLHSRPAHERRLWAAADAGHVVLPDPPPYPDEDRED